MTTLVPSFLDKSSSFLQIMRITIMARMSVSFSHIPLPSMELAALERLKIHV